jgi:parallel beta-helix repeat protein
MMTMRRSLWLTLALLAVAGAAPAQPCPGDCNGDRRVTVDELLTGIGVGLDETVVGACPAFDLDGDYAVAVHELVRGMHSISDGCAPITCAGCISIEPDENVQEAILEALIEAQPGDVIFLRAGVYELSGQLSLSVSDVTIRGEGMGQTILSFRNQTSGGEGLLVRADRFTLEDLALEDGPGDLFKIEGCNGVTVRRVRAEWTGGPDTANGAYGLYPVQCTDVLIEDSVVKGASDAGIYVGQSRNIIVRRNRVEYNVAGIEIENSNDADVHHNLATRNTGGILVFNLPDPPVQDGRRTRVFANHMVENNTHNFAPAGNTVAAVPDGTGFMLLANDEVEIFDNLFRNNNSAHIIVISYNTAVFFGIPRPSNPRFDPYSESIYITGNTYAGGGDMPDSDLNVVAALLRTEENPDGLPLPNILLDGDVNPARLEEGTLPAELRTCIQESRVTLADLDVDGLFMNISRDPAPFDCAHDRLPPVSINPKRPVEIAAGPNVEEELLAALIEARPGDVISLAAGRYELSGPLSLTVSDVTLRGAGMDETILSFANQTTGSQGLLVRANRFVLEDLGLEDAPGDLFKIEGCDGVIVRRVRAEWTGGPATENGAYGLYPVQCRDVLIEDSVVRGASDAGIYVGQSRNIIVRRNVVEFNVAGIEIENSTDADVYENVAANNTGGILVFNLPRLPVKDGRRTRVFGNQIFENNTANFAPAGNIVAAVPAGTGFMILANDEVEVSGNTFRDNDTTHALVLSYKTVEAIGIPPPNDPAFDSYSESIFFTGNVYEGGGTMPDVEILVNLLGLPLPHLIIDGDEDGNKLVDGMLPAELRTCVRESSVELADLNLAGRRPGLSRDPAVFDCTLRRLSSVAIPGVR